MLKRLFFILSFLIIFFIFPAKGASETNKHKEQMIPEDAIRLRILAHSNDAIDQEIKHEVRHHVNAQITDWVKSITTIDEARELISQRLSTIEATVDQVLAKGGIHQSAKVTYAQDVNFPDKHYGPFYYPAGTYEAVVITLGDGEGDNWWCVLFPPLCFLDFTADEKTEEKNVNSTATETNDSDEENLKVKFFLFEWLSSL